MKVYLAGFKTIENRYDQDYSDILLLNSFYDYKNKKRIPDYIYNKDHLLDSGAFSLFNPNKNIDFDVYTNKYCEFIKETNQKYFFELDIDLITSLNYTESLRDRIEQSVGRQTIPVWRPSRGLDYWYKMCEEYDYIAISASGAYDSAWTRKKGADVILNNLINIAKSNNCKVHGLGFTSVPMLHKVSFYSVDSTSWISAAKFGEVRLFCDNYKRIKSIKAGSERRLKDASSMHLFHFKEWVKFQKWADSNL